MRKSSVRRKVRPDSADQRKIGQNLRHVRKRSGLTQAEVAEKLGTKQALVSDYELGKLRLHGRLLIAFAKLFRTSADEILGIKDAKPNGIVTDRRFIRRLQQIEALPKRKKQALLTTLDEFLRGASSTRP